MKLSWLIGFLVVASVVVAAVLAGMYFLPLDTLDRSPAQPIAFSHKVHAGDNGIPCLYCHRAAPSSSRAGIPSVSDCRACHLYISPDDPEIRKIEAYWEKREPIPWVRVYSLPDHVYFAHKMHLRAGIACASCHGDVASMQRVSRSVKLEMGWCLDCHRRHNVGIDCWMCHI